MIVREYWIQAQFQEIARLLNGITYKKEQCSTTPKVGFKAILRANNIKDGLLNTDELVYVTEGIINTDQLIRKDDIIIAMSSGSVNLVGKSAIAKKDFNCSFGAFCSLLRINSKINAVYVHFYFQSSAFRTYLSNSSKGSNINNLKKEHILNAELSLPPLPEQRAIVDKLETLLSELDNAVASLKQAKEQIKTYRQSVLKAVFTGKLTEEWRKQQTDLPTSEELLAQIQTERQKYYEQQLADYKAGKEKTKPKKPIRVQTISNNDACDLPILPNQWKWVVLGDLTVLITKGSSPNWQGYNYIAKGDVMFVTSENVQRGSLELSNPKFIEDGFYNSHPTYNLKETDVLLNIVGASIGRSCIYNLKHKATINQAVALIRLTSPGLGSYISTYLNSSTAEKFYNQNKVETARANISLQDVYNIPIPLASSLEIESICKEIDSRFSTADQLDQAIDESLTKAEALKQSLLKQAFEGRLLNAEELTATRHAADWEPAEKLLDRIKSQDRLVIPAKAGIHRQRIQ